MPRPRVCGETRRGSEMSLGLWSHRSGAGGLGGGELGLGGELVAEPRVGAGRHLGEGAALRGSRLDGGGGGE